ncbi:Uncharacterized protein Rs2_41000 [Raphanus sativus]|nr:Uncharacterized protein Rs2_41000 [Raphanus sativus]
MEDFLELEKFLELECGEQLGNLDSSIEVTMEDFIELEEWLESDQKLHDERNAMGKDMETSIHKSETSYLAVPEHLRPICGEEAVGICKRVKRIHDPVKIMVPCTVVKAESPIPPERGVHLDSCNGVFNDH